MAVQSITYGNKTQIYANNDVADANKVKADDMNEIKSVVNNNATELTNTNTGLTALSNYTNAETQVGKWTNNKPLYRCIIQLSAFPNNSSTSYATNISNIDKVIMVQGSAWSSNATFPLPYEATDSGGGAIEIVYLKDTNSVRIATHMDRTGLTGIAILYYTKTTD